jgi:hypothetical protein
MFLIIYQFLFLRQQIVTNVCSEVTCGVFCKQISLCLYD